MAQKVTTASKMKSRQETTSLGQIATVTAKSTISDKHLLTPTQDVLKFRRATWDPLPGRASKQLLNMFTSWCEWVLRQAKSGPRQAKGIRAACPKEGGE